MRTANTPAGTPTPIPIFAPVERPDSAGLESSGGSVKEVKEETVESEAGGAALEAVCEVGKDVGSVGGVDDDDAAALEVEVEVEDPEVMTGTPIVVKARGSTSKLVVLKPVVHWHVPPRQQNDL